MRFGVNDRLRLVVQSLWRHGWMNLSVACGVGVAAAVLTGALLVGDSLRGSLRALTLQRLGRIDAAVVAGRFFRAKLADELANAPDFRRHAAAAVPLVLLRASVETAAPAVPARANQVNLIGGDERFWHLGAGRPARMPGSREIALNRPLAEQLGVRVGEPVILRFSKPAAIPAESAFGQKTETVAGWRLTVAEILPAEGLGRFSLRADQHEPRNAYVSLAAVQSQLDKPGQANVLLAAGDDATVDPPAEQAEALQRLLRPTPADYGLSIERTPGGVFRIASDRMILAPAVEGEIVHALRSGSGSPLSLRERVRVRAGANEQRSPHPNPLPEGEGAGNLASPLREGTIAAALVYLANTIAVGSREIPYSTVAAEDFIRAADGKPLPPLADDEVMLNSWAAEQLHAKPGDMVRIDYFQPESVAGRLREKSVSLRFAGVARSGDDQRTLVPPLPGVTDRSSMADWTPPFPFNIRRIRPVDERYWREHGAAPKAFVSLATGRRLWSSRFGQSTLIVADRLPQPLELDPAAMGFVFQPLKRQGLAASAGSTPFDVLFLAFSSFLIVAAVMLAALLLRLAVERRAAEIGILLAVGFSRRQVARLLAAEGFWVAAGGSLLGVAAGVGYAAVLITGLNTWWRAAVTTPFLHLYATPRSLAIGFGVSTAAAMLAILVTARRIARVSPRRLLAGETSEEGCYLSGGTGVSPVSATNTGGTPVPPSNKRRRAISVDARSAGLRPGDRNDLCAAPSRRAGGGVFRRRRDLACLAAGLGRPAIPRRGDWLGRRRRPRQHCPPGLAQRRPPPGPQHAHHGPGRLGRVPHRFGQRISARSFPTGA